MEQAVRMGQLPRPWNNAAKSITFCVTEDCELSCRYCYMTGKNSRNKMSFDIARRAVDYVLADRAYFREDAVVWEFIGGEPFLEIKLIDRISDYIKQQMFLRGHPWFEAYRFNFSTNGLLYHTPAVQRYIAKNRGHVSIGISIDGNRVKHNLQRVYKDGTGSFDRVMKNVPLWLSQMPDAGTKATFAHDDLPYLKDSIVALWEMGIKMVAANVVFEDVWVDGDDDLFERQLVELADYILEHQLYDEYSVRFFDPHVGNALAEDDLDANYCGVGNMIAIDCRGDLFPCIRFYDQSLSHRKGRRIGDVYTGIDHDRLRPFHALTLRTQSPSTCINCTVGKGCAWCSGCNYDNADSDTIFQRATFICRMHQANARANEYFWRRYAETTGRVSEKERLRPPQPPRQQGPQRFLYIMTRDDAAPYCHYRNPRSDNPAIMDNEVFVSSVKFCADHGFVPVFLGRPAPAEAEAASVSIVTAGTGAAEEARGAIFVHDNAVVPIAVEDANAILLLDRAYLTDLSGHFEELTQNHARINIVPAELPLWGEDDVAQYEVQLGYIAEALKRHYAAGRRIEVNVLTDLWHLTERCDCGAGEDSFTVAPNGKIYLCPAFYFADPQDTVGTLETGIHPPVPQLLKADSSPYCRACDVYSCRRCKFLNKTLTGEILIPSRIQCLVSHVERKVAMDLQHALIREGLLRPANTLGPLWYADPLELVATQTRGRR